MDSVLCVIPARGGSKEVPHKNRKLLNGIPLVAYSIIHALECGIPPEKIVVSSDDDLILEIAEGYNVCRLKRPEEISGDHSPSEMALLHTCDEMDFSHGAVVMLQPTSPIRLNYLLAECLETYFKRDYNSLLTVTMFDDFFWQEKKVYKDGNIDSYIWTPSYDINRRSMRQNISRDDFKYFENGNIYITDCNTLRNTKCRIGNNNFPYVISSLEGLQIDTEEDWHNFEIIYKGFQGDNNA